MNAKELKDILEAHLHWLKEDCDGWASMRADLSGADLSGVDLRGANLRGADLRGADLRRAVLRYADLSGTDLKGAVLAYAVLRYTILEDADLRGANLRGAVLRYAVLRYADLSNADLGDTDLEDADLRYANLRGANLSDETLQEVLPICCPEYGSFIGWKKAGGIGGHPEVIIKLRITEDAKRSSATGRKCRCSKAVVLGFETLGGENIEITETRSRYDNIFIYRLGETVEVKDFDEDRKNECAPGIHFFITRQEAVNY